jgi:hypothetical protein
LCVCVCMCVCVCGQIQEAPTHADVLPSSRSVSFEMNKETLETMLDGLGKIRDQLASISAGGAGPARAAAS